MSAIKLSLLEENYPPMQVVHRQFSTEPKSDADTYRFGFNGQETTDEIYGGGGFVNYLERGYDPRRVQWITVDGASEQYPAHTPYGFTLQNPIAHKEVDGDVVETAWDVLNVGLGVASLVDNVKNKKVGGALLDIGGLIYDGFATVVPGLPAGASTAIKAKKAGTTVVKVADNLSVGGRTFKVATQAAKYKVYYDKYGGKVADAIWDAGKGGANKLASALKTKTGEIAHHLIPTELIERSTFLQKAINEGFEFNGTKNGINIKFPGRHPNSYWEGVNKMIEETKALMPKASAKSENGKCCWETKNINTKKWW